MVIKMTNDYETTIAFEKYEEIFWKKLNKEFDLEDMGDETSYKLKFYCTAPPVEEMSECIDTDGYLHTHEKLVSANDGFVDTSFGLVANFPDTGGFEIALNYTDEDDKQMELDIDALEGVKGYYYNGRFYNDTAHTSVLPYYEGHYHFDWTNYNPDDPDNDYGIITYLCSNESYTVVTDKPEWIDFEGNIIVKCIFLVKAENDFVIAYCRYSTPLYVRDVVTLPVGSKFVQIGECTL